MQIAQLMNTELAMISPEASLVDGMNLLGKTNSDALYLVDSNQHLLGIVPDFSLLKAYLNGSNLESSLEKLLSPHIPTVSAKANICEVAPLFRDGQHCRMAVVDEGKLIGQIERVQILAFFAENNDQNQKFAEDSIPENFQQSHIRLDASHEEHALRKEMAPNSSLRSLLKR